jgi:hypothetical protein
MTRNGSSPAVSTALADDGTRLFFWDGGSRVELPPVPLDRRGRWQVQVYQGETLLTRGRVHFDDLHDRQQLALHCAPDGDEAVKAWLTRFVEVATVVQDPSAQADARTLDVRQLAHVSPERVEWLWKPLLPVGRPVSLEGNPGVGKSNVVLKIAAHLTTGRAFPTVLEATAPQRAFAPCTVCLLGAEDDAADTVRPRLEVNGGDASRFYLLEGWRHPDGSRGLITLQDLHLLQRMLEQYHPALLVVDPLQAFFGRGLDMNHANETRPVLADVAELCKEQRCTILYVRHLAKAHREQAIYAALGSIDIAAHVRSAMLVGVDPEDPTRRILAHHKASNAAEAASLAFTLTSVEREMFRDDASSVMVEASRVDWAGFSPLKAADLLQPRGTEEEQEDKSALEQAREFLQELLQQGPVLAKEVHAAAKAAGVEMITLRRVKARMLVRVHRRKQEDLPQQQWPWEWHLLDDQQDDTP